MHGGPPANAYMYTGGAGGGGLSREALQFRSYMLAKVLKVKRGFDVKERELREAFEADDENSDGTIEIEQFRRAMVQLGFEASSEVSERAPKPSASSFL
jgi:Ca2+-binding EF-hand superfamily protein